jgi:hypothetical protein
MANLLKYLPLIALLLLAGTLMFSIVLLPLAIVSESKPTPIFITFSLIVVITTVASLVSLIFYIALKEKK